MTSPRTRSEIIAEIAELWKEQLAANRSAVFGGWTSEDLKSYDDRADRLKLLQRELDGLLKTG